MRIDFDRGAETPGKFPVQLGCSARNRHGRGEDGDNDNDKSFEHGHHEGAILRRSRSHTRGRLTFERPS